MTGLLAMEFRDALAIALLIATPGLPLVFASLAWIRPRFGCRGRLAAAATLPAIAAGFFLSPGTSIELPWLLAGSEIGIDAVGRLFLITAGLIWAAAAVYASATLHGDMRERAGFFGFLLFSMSGNFGLVIAHDILIFYLCFTLMSMAALGMIVHSRKPAARAAGRVYMTLVIAGDMSLYAAFAIIALATAGELDFASARAALAEVPGRHVAIALIVLGFGVKVGLIGLHVALPLIYRHAPVAAAAALAGPVINAGLLGLLRLLPLGAAGFGTEGIVLIACGISAAFAAAIAGSAQREPRVVLAYSSISQMGIMLLAIGFALLEPSHAPAVTMAVSVYAMHHAFTKSALFLGAGVANRVPTAGTWHVLLLAGLALAALSLVGAPLTSGMLAKDMLKDAMSVPEAGGLADIVPWTAVATTVLSARFLYLVRQRKAHDGVEIKPEPTMLASWLAVSGGSLLVVWLVPAAVDMSVSAVVSAVWPILLGLALSAIAWKLRFAPVLPAGDILLALQAVAGALRRAFDRLADDWLHAARRRVIGIAESIGARPRLKGLLDAAEAGLTAWPVASTLFVVLVLALAAAAS